MAVLGLDGRAKGGIGVVLEGDAVSVHHFTSVSRTLELGGEFKVIAIDTTIDLLDSGPRRADALARRNLPGRASTIFNAPLRACLGVQDYPAAQEIARRLLGKGLLTQSFALLAKIEEVERFHLRVRCPVWEVHPELSFAKINGGRALAPKTTWSSAQRRAVLASVGIGFDDVDPVVGRIGAIHPRWTLPVDGWRSGCRQCSARSRAPRDDTSVDER